MKLLKASMGKSLPLLKSLADRRQAQKVKSLADRRRSQKEKGWHLGAERCKASLLKHSPAGEATGLACRWGNGMTPIACACHAGATGSACQWIRKTQVLDDEKNPVFVTKPSRDENGNPITSRQFFNDDGDLITSRLFFDDDGNPITSRFFDDDGNIVEKEWYDLAWIGGKECNCKPWQPQHTREGKHILDHTPEHQQNTVMEAFVDLRLHNLLQPNRALGPGVSKRQKQWENIVGGKTKGLNFTMIGLGGVAGMLSGLVMGLIPELRTLLPIAIHPSIILAVVAAAAGGYGGNYFSRTGSYHDSMMLVIANERWSVIRPELVTAQAEIWIPKALLAWRAHDWRYKEGRPYLWVHLTLGERIQDTLHHSTDYLLLQNDNYRAGDAAVYAQRSLNRMISDSALDYAEIESDSDAEANKLAELMPWFSAMGIVLGGILLVMMTSG